MSFQVLILIKFEINDNFMPNLKLRNYLKMMKNIRMKLKFDKIYKLFNFFFNFEVWLRSLSWNPYSTIKNLFILFIDFYFNKVVCLSL